MKFLFHTVLVLISISVKRNVAEEKRLLLNDPEALITQIHALEQEVNQQKAENQVLRNDVDDLKRRFRAMESESGNQGSVFIRWGKHTCPSLSGTEQLYFGTAGGSFYTHSGGGANTLCLPHHPEPLPDSFPLVFEGNSTNRVGYLYGGEYQFSLKDVVVQDDVPCSVCRAKMATSTMMIAAKRSCPSGWTMQYTGLLTSEWHGGQMAEYVCVDEDPDFVERSRVNENGRLFYPVVTVCGTLPCPPYKSSTLVACVVCSA
ncbi:uncharacterized protein [Magallana gigas]|uniref:uncharacterized protein n=1 Tax=Magallana gigas TaxID=29159 RepID=UPI003340445E